MSLFRSKNIDTTTGPVLSKLLLFSLPVLVSNLIQIMFSVADKAVLSRAGNMDSVAAVNAVIVIIDMIVTSCAGLSNGAVVITAQAIGRRDGECLRKTVSTAIMTAFGLGLAVGAAGVAVSGLLPGLVDCPDSCYGEAVIYLAIYMAATPAILIYNFCAAAIRASGDSTTPSIYIVIAGLCNIGLNIILCLVLEHKVAAVAIATLVSQCVGAALSLSKLYRIGGNLKPELKLKNFNPVAFGNILRIGLPCALSQAVFSIGNLPVNSAINSLGSPTITGNGAALECDHIESAVTTALGTGVLTFTGQNWGCGRRDRIRRTFLHSLWLGVGVSVVMSGFFWIFREQFLSLLIPSGEGYAEAMRVGTVRMLYVNIMWFIVALRTSMEEAVKGIGITLPSTVNNLVCVLGLRIIWVKFIFPLYPQIECIDQCFLVSWLATLFGDLIIFAVVSAKKKLFLTRGDGSELLKK